jgi:hypothetical protein
MVWAYFRSEQIIPEKVQKTPKGQYPRGRTRRRWEQQVRKDVTHRRNKSDTE